MEKIDTKNVKSWQGVETLAVEIIKQSERNARRWFIAWIVTLCALIITNSAWIYVFNTYEYISQDGQGINSINTGHQEDLDIGTKGQTQKK